MKLEDQLKNTFDHFEPEVDPSVWAKVSAQLPSSAPVFDGGSFVSSNILKSLVAKIAPFAGWIAGATVIVGLGIIWKLNSTEVVVPVQPVINQTNNVTLPINKVDIKQESTNEQQSGLDTKTEISKEINKVKSASSNPSKGQTFIAGHFSNNSTSEEIISSQNNSNKASSDNKASTNSVTTSSALNNKSTEILSSVNKTEVGNNQTSKTEDILVEPVLMLNTRGGFAPLSVTALTNQNGKKADFNFGDGTQINNVANASHRFDSPGIYTVKCIIAGREIETTVEVLGQLPTVFSPNGDGVNDQFIIGGAEVTSVDVHIYDRTGRIMLNTKGKQVIWDGAVLGGQLAEIGTYFYDIFATSNSGVTYKQKGTINLFR